MKRAANIIKQMLSARFDLYLLTGDCIMRIFSLDIKPISKILSATCGNF